MARQKKKPEERRAELVGAARRLFSAEGYSAVSVQRIVGELSVAQGTFYYYFASKEEILDAVVADYVDALAARLAELGSDPSLDPREAFQEMVRAEMGFDAERARELFAIQGVDMHTRIFSRTLLGLAPSYLAVIERGIAAGIFKTPCPDLIAETIILHVHFLFDRDLLGWSAAEYDRRLEASADLLGLLLELPQGSFHFGKSPSRPTEFLID
jgi:AcrR family transcriptional regulator